MIEKVNTEGNETWQRVFSLHSAFSYWKGLWGDFGKFDKWQMYWEEIFFAGKGEWMIGRRHAAVVLSTKTVDDGQKGQLPCMSCHS